MEVDPTSQCQVAVKQQRAAQVLQHSNHSQGLVILSEEAHQPLVLELSMQSSAVTTQAPPAADQRLKLEPTETSQSEEETWLSRSSFKTVTEAAAKQPSLAQSPPKLPMTSKDTLSDNHKTRATTRAEEPTTRT